MLQMIVGSIPTGAPLKPNTMARKDSDYVQIDLMEEIPERGMCRCNMYTPEGCVKIYMSLNDADHLRRNGFFTRKENKADSAGVLNTTEMYIPSQQ
jgi:hypothetical protein